MGGSQGETGPGVSHAVQLPPAEGTEDGRGIDGGYTGVAPDLCQGDGFGGKGAVVPAENPQGRQLSIVHLS